MTSLVRVAAAPMAAALMTLAVTVTPALAQEEGEKELGWFYTAELGFTLAGGNAGSSSLSYYWIIIPRSVPMPISTWISPSRNFMQ